MNAAAEDSGAMKNPISLALYSFAFRSGPEARHLADAVLALTEDVPEEVVLQSLSAIRAELEKPSQVVSRLLPRLLRSEEECRSFLSLVVDHIYS